MMKEQEVEYEQKKPPISEMNMGSPQQIGQKVIMQEDVHEQENDSQNRDVATLPKGLKKSPIKIGKNKEIEYVPENPEFNFEMVKASPHFKIKPYPEAIYLGEIKNGKRNGWGVMKYNSSRVYEGEWVDGIR